MLGASGTLGDVRRAFKGRRARILRTLRTFFRIPALVLGFAAAASGCGGGVTTYTVEKTRACLREDGRRVRPAPADDFVAANALGGAFNVRFPENQVTLTFGLDEAEAERIAGAYRRFRGRNIGIEDALQVRRNVVLLWGLTPRSEDGQAIDGCLT